jgi:hypothetical protein
MKTKAFGIIFILLGLLAIIHHFIINGRLFDIGDILHHEFFEAILLTAGITILITTHNN